MAYRGTSGLAAINKNRSRLLVTAAHAGHHQDVAQGTQEDHGVSQDRWDGNAKQVNGAQRDHGKQTADDHQ
jgi:hypothetical protein